MRLPYSPSPSCVSARPPAREDHAPGRQVKCAYPTGAPAPCTSALPPGPRPPRGPQPAAHQLPLDLSPYQPAWPVNDMGKSRRRRAYPQQIVTTRLLYCLQDPFAHLSRLQRI